jgi:hypothetical protein
MSATTFPQTVLISGVFIIPGTILMTAGVE